jgi:uncharacterized membrane protein
MDSQLDKRANIRTLRRLHRDGLLNGRALAVASSILRPRSAWLAWARQMLLLFGSAMVLAGVIFFFAYNWAAMGRYSKFVLIEAGIVAAAIASYWRGRDRLAGKILLLSASILVGVLLAVYGQTYQTGADAYELFTGWTVLILGWVLVSDFAGLWVVWLILLNTGAILYWKQVGDPAHSMPYESLCLVLAFFNGLALILYELGIRQGLEWLRGRWLRGLLFAGVLLSLSIPAVALIVSPESIQRLTLLATMAWGVVLVVGYASYRYKIHDMIPIALVISNVSAVLLILIGKILFHGGRWGGFSWDPVLFLLFSLIVLLVVSGAVFILRRTAATMAKNIGRGGDE